MTAQTGPAGTGEVSQEEAIGTSPDGIGQDFDGGVITGRTLVGVKDRGLFIVFEGGDGVGKTTQLNYLESSLRKANLPVLRTFEPGATTLGVKLRELLLDGTEDPHPRTEALLYTADKAEHVAKLVRPALEAGQIVISDRYVDSMIAYQSAGRGLDPEEISRLADWATGGLQADLTILLDTAPEAAVGEITEKDRLESAGAEFHARVRKGFLKLAQRNRDRYLVLDARAPREEIAAAVRERLSDFGLQLPDPLVRYQ